MLVYSEAVLALLLILSLASARLTRVITTDKVTSSLRLRLFKRYPPSPARGQPAHWLGALVDCTACMGFWVAGIVVLIAAQFVSLPIAALWWPAVAAAALYLASLLDPA